MRAWALLVTLAVTTKPAGAEGLSLASAQAEARAHAPDVAELDARLQGAQLVADASGRVLRTNPQLSGTYVPGPLAGNPGELSWEVSVQQTFDVSGSWRPRAKSADADRDRSGHERENGLRALDEAVATAVAELAQAQRRANGLQRIAGLLTISAEAARKQLETGQGNQLDVDAADLDLAAARADVAHGATNVEVARGRLARLIGRASSSDLVVDDPLESDGAPSQLDLAALVDRDPRVKSAMAELDAARFELAAHERTIWPDITLGASYGYVRRDIPVGSFKGPSASGLSALSAENEITFTLSVPLPLFERKQPERARARGRILLADAQLRKAQADVRQQLGEVWAGLQGASKAYSELAKTREIIDRELDLLDKAFRAGALDTVARALAIRRLQDAASRYDAAVLDLRIARAQWARRTAAP